MPALAYAENKELASRQQEALKGYRWKKIPTLPEWMAASMSSRFEFMNKRSSPEILAIDAALNAYHQVVNRREPLARESEAAITLLEAIEVYLAIPRGPLHKRVKRAVKELRAITLYTLTDLRWQKIRNVAPTKQAPRPMIPAVWSEVHSPNHARVGHDPNLPNEPDPWLHDDPKNPQCSEKYLFQYLRRVREQHGAQEDGVHYIEDSEKWRYQIVFDDQGFANKRFCRLQGQLQTSTPRPLTSAGADYGTWIYAVDGDGVFYTETESGSTTSLNHCSFLQGRAVKCAGNIGISQGIIGYIDNASGHYRPSRKDLLNCLDALKPQVGPLIFPWVLVRDHGGRYSNAVYEADKFLATRGNCRPVGQMGARNLRYDAALNRFKDQQELLQFMDGQEGGFAKIALEKKFSALVQHLQETAPKDSVGRSIPTGQLNGPDRAVFQEAYLAGLLTPAHDRYFANDQPLKDWIGRRKDYGVPVSPKAARLL